MFVYNPKTADIEFKKILYTEVENVTVYTFTLKEYMYLIAYGVTEVLDGGYLEVVGQYEVTD